MQPYRTLQYSLQNDHKVKSAPLKNNFPPQKINITTFLKVGFIAGMLYWTALVVAS